MPPPCPYGPVAPVSRLDWVRVSQILCCTLNNIEKDALEICLATASIRCPYSKLVSPGGGHWSKFLRCGTSCGTLSNFKLFRGFCLHCLYAEEEVTTAVADGSVLALFICWLDLCCALKHCLRMSVYHCNFPLLLPVLQRYGAHRSQDI